MGGCSQISARCKPLGIITLFAVRTTCVCLILSHRPIKVASSIGEVPGGTKGIMGDETRGWGGLGNAALRASGVSVAGGLIHPQPSPECTT